MGTRSDQVGSCHWNGMGNGEDSTGNGHTMNTDLIYIYLYWGD